MRGKGIQLVRGMKEEGLGNEGISSWGGGGKEWVEEGDERRIAGGGGGGCIKRDWDERMWLLPAGYVEEACRRGGRGRRQLLR